MKVENLHLLFTSWYTPYVINEHITVTIYCKTTWKGKNKVVFIKKKILTGHKYRQGHTLEKDPQCSTFSSNPISKVLTVVWFTSSPTLDSIMIRYLCAPWLFLLCSNSEFPSGILVLILDSWLHFLEALVDWYPEKRMWMKLLKEFQKRA